MISRLNNSGQSSIASTLIITVLAFIAIIAGGYIVYFQFNSPSNKVLPTSAPISSSSSVNSSYAILKPAIVPSKIIECSATLSYDSNGNPSPIQCSNGGLNILAWNALAALEPTVMKLGYTPSAAQVQAAICIDGNAANQDSTSAISAPIETTAYQLASLYYNWSFSLNPTALLTHGC